MTVHTRPAQTDDFLLSELFFERDACRRALRVTFAHKKGGFSEEARAERAPLWIWLGEIEGRIAKRKREIREVGE